MFIQLRDEGMTVLAYIFEDVDPQDLPVLTQKATVFADLVRQFWQVQIDAAVAANPPAAQVPKLFCEVHGVKWQLEVPLPGDLGLVVKRAFPHAFTGRVEV